MEAELHIFWSSVTWTRDSQDLFHAQINFLAPNIELKFDTIYFLNTLSKSNREWFIEAQWKTAFYLEIKPMTLILQAWNQWNYIADC